MSLFHALILGLVQGVTEFLPISSSGFLVFIPSLFGWDLQSVWFDGVIHLATLAAIVMALRKELVELVTQFPKAFWWIVGATIPVLLIGFLLEEVLGLSFRSLQIVAWSFVVWGIVLFFVDRFTKTQVTSIQQVGWKRALLIGVAQVIALIPGTSRSGITITAGLLTGLSRQTATTFSFLLSIPTILAAGGLSLLQLFKTSEMVEVGPLLVGGVSAFVSALVTVYLLRSWLGKGTYQPIALFRVLLGIVLLLILR